MLLQIKKQLCLLLVLVTSLLLPVQAQDTSGFTQKGRVIDTRGELVPGANVSVVGQQRATMTDGEGNFSIRINGETGSLQISSMGYNTQTVTVKQGSAPITITLEGNQKLLDEVVIVGYGVQRKTALTSSVEVVKSDALLQMATPNLDQALNGQAAGLQVMTSHADPTARRESDIRIRGINGSPLLVIDGVPRYSVNASEEMRLSDLNPDDIESISILKDAAGAAVYGSRAANGVILVTTKRGQKSPKLRVQYRGQYNLQQATQFPEFVDAYHFAQLYNRAIDNSPGKPHTKYSDEDMESIRLGNAPNKFGNENLIDYLKKTASSTSHNLSLQGGSESLRYFLSGGYTNTQGLYSGISRDRYNYSIKLDASLTRNLNLSVDVIGSRSANKNTGYASIEGIYNSSPIQVLRYTNDKLASINGYNPLIGILGLGGYLDSRTNFSTLTGHISYKLPWIKGLSLYAKATTDYNVSEDETVNLPVTLYNFDNSKGVEEFTEDIQTMYPKKQTSVKLKNIVAENSLLEAGMNYNRSFHSLHDVSAMLVANYQEQDIRSLEAANKDVPGSYPLIIGTALPENTTLVGLKSSKQRASLIGRATYGYGNRYFIEGNFRVDGSTSFAPENRWGFFPSASASWVLSNEGFFKNWKQDVLSNVKFRSSAGILGNDAGVLPYSYLFSYKSLISQGYPIGKKFKHGLGLETGSYPNPRLMWGKSEDFNMGLDLGFASNRFEVSFEHYWRYLTNDIRLTDPFNFPPSVGANGALPYENYGKVKAWGWDLTLIHKNTIGKKFKYDLTLTFTKTDDITLDAGDESSLSPNRRRVGRSSMLWWLYQADGLFRSAEELSTHPLDQDQKGNSELAPGDIRYVDVEKDNKLNERDMIAVKNSSYPDMSYSIKLGMRYAGFFFNAMLQGVAGYKQLIYDRYSLYSNSLQRFQRYHYDNTWTAENPQADYPRVKFASSTDNNRKASTFWLKDCDFIRLKSISIGYVFAPELLRKIKVNSLSISLQGSNLLTLSSLENGVDPESLRGYPTQRSYGLALNVGF